MTILKFGLFPPPPKKKEISPHNLSNFQEHFIEFDNLEGSCQDHMDFILVFNYFILFIFYIFISLNCF